MDKRTAEEFQRAAMAERLGSRSRGTPRMVQSETIREKAEEQGWLKTEGCGKAERRNSGLGELEEPRSCWTLAPRITNYLPGNCNASTQQGLMG